MTILSNGELRIEVSGHGAELQSIRKGDVEYLWQGDPSFWGRRSPVLFPIVGSVWESRYRIDGVEYQLGQHGFARDMDFVKVCESDTEVRYRLESSPQTKEKFPYDFCLEIAYRLHGRCLDVIWEVSNPSETDIHFQIGAHPAFNYPDYDPETVDRGIVELDGNEDLQRSGFKGKGCVDPEARFPMPVSEDGRVHLERDTFDDVDTLMLEDNQVHKIAFLKCDGSPYLTVAFDAPVVAIWSPPKRNAPFFCIEPWYGRCDRAVFTGEFKDRDWVNALASGATFTASYTITLD